MEAKGKKQVIVRYWGGWGYRPRARYVQQALENRFQDQVEVQLAGDKEKTGRLQVSILDGEEEVVIHSKHDGDGFVTDKNVDEFLDKFSKHL